MHEKKPGSAGRKVMYEFVLSAELEFAFQKFVYQFGELCCIIDENVRRPICLWTDAVFFGISFVGTNASSKPSDFQSRVRCWWVTFKYTSKFRKSLKIVV